MFDLVRGIESARAHHNNEATNHRRSIPPRQLMPAISFLVIWQSNVERLLQKAGFISRRASGNESVFLARALLNQNS
jgi:hypothetical protein